MCLAYDVLLAEEQRMLSRKMFIYSHEALQGIEVCFFLRGEEGEGSLLGLSLFSCC